MRHIVAVILSIWCSCTAAQDWEDRQIFNPVPGGNSLRIMSSTDTALFASIIEGFVAANPDVQIEYIVTDTAHLDQYFRANPDDFDIVISSAMDLQLKLANDGFAQVLEQVSLPDWASWRNSLFAFTQEPAAIVINRAAFAGYPIPKSRQDLIKAMRARPTIFQNRVGTYDVRQSGLGYFYATQDARTSETFWRLMEVFGGLDVNLYCCSGAMIDDLITGRLAVAYNVLGSYAEARLDSEDSIHIIRPTDFQTTMMRTALVSKTTQQQDAATAFITYLTDLQTGASAETAVSNLPPLAAGTDATEPAGISLEPALLTFLDTLKRRKFLSEWENAVLQE